MPKVRPLSKVQQLLQRNQQADRLLLEVLAAYKVRTEKRDQDVAEDLKWDRGRVSRIKANPGRTRLEDVRTLAHEIEVTPEQWLQIGGFEVRK